jgi:hypothetical protein
MYDSLRVYGAPDVVAEMENLTTELRALRKRSDSDIEQLGERLAAAYERGISTVENSTKVTSRGISKEEACADVEQFLRNGRAQLEAERNRRFRAAQWSASVERRRERRTGLIAGAVLLVGAVLLGWSWYLYERELLFPPTDLFGERIEPSTHAPSTVQALIVVFGVVLLTTAVSVLITSRARAREEFRAKFRLAELDAATTLTAQALSEAPDDPTRLIAYWTSTQQRLDKFQNDARGQLRSAYLLSQAAAVLGFAVVLALGVTAAFTSTTANTVVVGGIAAVAAALSGYVSHTFQVTYDRALRQTMAYFEQPVVASQLLHGERLLTQFSDASGTARDEALLVLVRAATRTQSLES